MKKLFIGIMLLSTTAVFAQNYEVLYGMSLADSALIIEDFKSEGAVATRLNSNACGKTVSSRGEFCVVATNGEKIEVLYGMSLADSALIIEDFKSEGFVATRLNSNACGKTVNTRGEFCVVARR